MNNTLYQELQIPDLFVPCYKDKIFDRSVEMHLPLININKEFKYWLASLNIGLNSCRFFSAEPGHKYTLHKDISYSTETAGMITNCVKLNLIYNASNSKMIWYEEISNVAPTIVRNKVGDELRIYKKEQCSVIFESKVVGPACLINGLVIHTMINGNTTRHCYSLPLIDLTTNNRLTWDDAVNRLSRYIKQ